MAGKILVASLSRSRGDGNDKTWVARRFPLRWSATVSNGESITQWLDGIKAGEGADIQRLWNRYFQRLVRLAGARLPGHCRRVFDEEDVAISAFQSFCDRAGQGQFPHMTGRDDVWRLLATLTVRKAALMIRHLTRQKRGGGRVLGESALPTKDPAVSGNRSLVGIVSSEPPPDDAACYADAFEHLIKKLDNSTLRAIAIRKLEGYSVQEISTELGRSTRTIDRKLKLIRAIWEEGVG